MQFNMDNLFSVDNIMVLALQEELANTICDELAGMRQNYDNGVVPLEQINAVIDSFTDESLLTWTPEEIDLFYQIAGH